MSFAQTVLLGAIAGFTIYLGLPVGRIKHMSEKTRSFLSMISAGILFFLFIDIFEQLSAPIEDALTKHSLGEFAWLLSIFVIGFAAGLIGLIAFEKGFIRSHTVAADQSITPLSPFRLALMIATGIGLHNFSEGLAIGQSAGRGAIGLAAILIIGFGLHNATEGFGIVGPLMGSDRPSWKFLGVAGLIGGGPTFVGTLLGYFFISDAMSVLFLSLAAGALVYIVGELFHVNRRPGTKFQAGWGLVLGFMFAYLTDLILVAAGI